MTGGAYSTSEQVCPKRLQWAEGSGVGEQVQRKRWYLSPDQFCFRSSRVEQSRATICCRSSKVAEQQCGVVWYDVMWCGVVWCGVVWCGVVWCGVGGQLYSSL